jgi:hypothetical protein
MFMVRPEAAPILPAIDSILQADVKEAVWPTLNDIRS